MSAVTTRRQGSVTVIAFGEPPVNSLGIATRRALAQALEEALADTAVTAIVLTGQNGTFSGGADIKEFNSPAALAAPNLHDIIGIVESSPKPVVAAIAGVALGGGLEFAMGCHFRVAAATAKIGLPEVKLGLLPGGGGTQRLPRLIGVEGALNVMLGGEPLPATLFKGSPLIHDIAAADVVDAAVAFANGPAQDALRAGKLPRARDLRVREPNLEGLLGFVRTAVQGAFAQYPAPLKIVDCVEAAATKKFDDGLAVERQKFSELMVGPVASSLMHAFFAERATQKIPDVPDSTPTKEIKSAAVIGAGTMGSGIAITFLNVGIPVHLLELKQEALDAGVKRVRDYFEGQAKKGRIKPEQAMEKAKLLTPTLKYEDLAPCDIVIEAVFEEMGVKEKVFKTLDGVMKPGAILATNTSTLDVDRIAAVTKRPQDVIGTHFFSPANVMKLLEVVRGKATSKEVLATTMKLGKKLKKTAVVSGVCDGFIGNRMIEQYSRQAFFLLDEGASPEQVDKAVEKFGFMMGPFRMSDLAGNDVGAHIRARRAVEQPHIKYSNIVEPLVAAKRYGQKTNAGWYDYKPGDRTAYPSPVVAQMIEKYRADNGLKPRKIDDREIVDRLVYSLVNEAAKILEEGIALRASDVDIVYLTGYGFPIYRGGPLHFADEVGLYAVVNRMKELAKNPYGDPAFWTPAPLLAKLAVDGGTFAAWDAGNAKRAKAA